MRKTGPTEDEVTALADAMCMMLNDMAGDGERSVCDYVKARATIAMQPFLLEDYGDLPDIDWARGVVREVDELHGKRA